MKINKKGMGRCPNCKSYSMLSIVELPRNRRLWLCTSCDNEIISRRKPDQNAPNPAHNRTYCALRELLAYEDESVEALLLIRETLDRLDSSTTKGKLDQQQFEAIVKTVYRMKAVAHLLNAADLGDYEKFALREIIHAVWGPKNIYVNPQAMQHIAPKKRSP